MPQNVATICGHNAPTQPYVVKRATRCRQCGALLEPEANAIGPGVGTEASPYTGQAVSPAGVLAAYPGATTATSGES